MSQELENDKKNEGDSCRGDGSEAAIEFYFDNVSFILFGVLSVYYCEKMRYDNFEHTHEDEKT